MWQDPHRDAVDLFQSVAAHQFRRRPLSNHFSAAQGHQIVAIAGRHINIVQDGDHRQAALLAETMHQRQNIDLMSNIQRRGGFIEQQAATVLRHQHGDPRPLAFTAGEAVHQTMSERLQPHQRNRLFYFLTVRCAKATQRAVPWIAADRHQLAHRHTFGRRQLLRQIGHFAGKGFAAPALQRLPVQQHIACGRRLMTAKHFQ